MSSFVKKGIYLSKKDCSALVIVDVQNDFCPGGALAIPDGDKVVPIINAVTGRFNMVIATQDWHPADHLSFASQHPGREIMETVKVEGIDQVLWPDHCIQGTAGADFVSNLNTHYFTLILRKGTNPKLDSYSGFFENDRKTHTGLEFYLKCLGFSAVYLCGLATDSCVLFSALDAVRAGFKTYLIGDACRGVDIPEGNEKASIEKMEESGVLISKSKDLDL